MKRMTLAHLGPLLFWSLLCLCFLYPLLRFFALPLFTPGGPGAAWHTLIHDPLLGMAVRNTMRLGVGAALLAVTGGLALAWLLERRTGRWAAPLEALLWTLWLAPSYLLSTGWQALVAGPLSNWRPFIDSQGGIVVLLALKALPYACIFARPGWGALGQELTDAIRVHAVSRWRRNWLLGRLLLPMAGAAGAVAFCESVQEFGIPATLMGSHPLPLLTISIYERLANVPLDLRGAALMSWVLFGLTGIAVALQWALAKRYSAGIMHSASRAPERLKGGLGTRLLAGTALCGLSLALMIPLLALCIGMFRAPFALPWRSLTVSSAMAALGAILALAFALPLGHILARGMRTGQALDALIGMNLALPGLVLGAADLVAFNTDWLPLYGTPMALLIGYAGTQLPMLSRLLQLPIRMRHPHLMEAAHISGFNAWARWQWVAWPLLRTTVLSGGFLAFGFLFFELPVSALLAPPGLVPLGAHILVLDQSFQYAQAAQAGLAGVCVLGIFLLLARWLAGPLRGGLA